MAGADRVANILVYDVGSTYTKACAFQYDGHEFAFLGRGQSPTTLEDIGKGALGAKEAIAEQGVIFSPDVKQYSSCSAAGGLRMVALGYMPRVTAKAAKEVSMTAGARVMQVLSAEDALPFRREVLLEIRPDIILLSGGTDGGDESNVLENAQMIGELGCSATVIVACNTYARGKVSRCLSKYGVNHISLPNIMPTIHELNIGPAREAIHSEFIKQITKAQGLMAFRETLADQTVVPTPGAVLLASELLAKGTREQEGLGSILLLDLGGATTDIHSALPSQIDRPLEELGLIINNAKQFSYRTVEGNLGMRVSATGILDVAGVKALMAHTAPHFQEEGELLALIEAMEQNTAYVPSTAREWAVEYAMAFHALQIALRRHAGYYAQEADPVMGLMSGAPVGRDLRLVSKVLCVGGFFAHGDATRVTALVEDCFANPGISLLPIKQPKIVLDRDYLLYAMGVLGRHYQEATFTFLKNYYIK